MNKKILNIMGLIMLGALLFTSCKKDKYEENSVFKRFSDVEVTFHNNSPYSVTDYKLIQPNDSLYIDFTITSKKTGIYTVCVWEGGSGVPFLKIPIDQAHRYSYSDVVKLKMDSKVGPTSYRVWALDSAGIYIGDGYKKVNIDIESDFYYWAGRTMFVPDSSAKQSKSFLATSTGEVLNYTEAKANSVKVDMGYIFKDGKHLFYSLKNDPDIFAPYDLSSFTKNNTLFYCQYRTRQLSTFQRMKTGKQIYDVGAKKSTSKDLTKNIDADYLVYFKTEEGKYGAIYINSVSRNSANNGTNINIDIKVQK